MAGCPARGFRRPRWFLLAGPASLGRVADRQDRLDRRALPGRAADPQPATAGFDTVEQPRQPGPTAWIGTAHTVVADLNTHRPGPEAGMHPGAAGLGVFDDVRERLG